MLPAKPTGAYYPTHKLTKEERNRKISPNPRLYGFRKIERIFKQVGRPQLKRGSALRDRFSDIEQAHADSYDVPSLQSRIAAAEAAYQAEMDQDDLDHVERGSSARSNAAKITKNRLGAT
jgi:hypothetical protein